MYRDNSTIMSPHFLICVQNVPYFAHIFPSFAHYVPSFAHIFHRVCGMMISKIPWFPPQAAAAGATGAAGVQRLPLARRKLRAAGDRSFRIWKASDVAVS